MKKIYALIAVAAAGVMTASAFTGKAFDGQKMEPSQVRPESEIADIKAPVMNDAKRVVLNGFSRADEVEVNAALINSFNQGMYYLYSNNFQDENGEDVDEFRNLRNSALTVLEASDDLNTIHIKRFQGIDCVGDGIELVWNAETRQYDMELGQVWYVSSSYGDTKLAIAVDKDGDGKLETLETEGKLSFSLYLDGLVLDFDSWLYSVITVNGKKSFFSDLTIADLMILQPNATMTYTVSDKDDVVSNVNKDVYFSELTPDSSDPNDLGGFMVSNVMPFDEGMVVYFNNVELKTGDVITMYDTTTPADASAYVDANTRTGDFYICSLNVETNTYSPDVFAEYDINTNEFKFPTVPEVLVDDYAGFTSWFVQSTGGYTYNSFKTATQATITMKTNGINSVEVEEVAGAPEYYNLQGIKVANPAAGQIYIVKEGSKVSKRVF